MGDRPRSHHRTRRPTIHDVAARAGVSITTVSRIINKSSYFSEATAERVKQAIEQLNYAPRSSAQGLASRKFRTIGVVVDKLVTPFLLRLLSGIELESREAGYDLLIRAGGSHKNESRSLGHHNTDGLLVFAGVLSDEELAALYRQAFPVVALHSAPIPGTAIPVVNIENQQSAYELVSHLIQDHSCRRIAYLRGPEAQKDSYYREQGYARALGENGIPFDDTLVGFGGFDERIAHNTVLELLRAYPDIDGIFADDESAAGVYHALQELGLQIPDDIKVVGFDDDYLAPRLVPPLTTVHSPAELIGKTAVRLLLQIIDSGFAPIETVLPTHVVVRRSCGCQ